MNRDYMLQRLGTEQEWDIIVIGGGATGLGVAVDAASRGYKTVLVEQFDFAKGTSSRATKLVHGGVRYLAQGNIKLVMEALRERGYLLKNAPHLTTALPFVIPAYSLWDKFYYGIGLMVYDILSGTLSIGKTKVLSKKQAVQHLPGIEAAKLSGGILYYDGQFDDARLATELAKTAVQHGAAVVNYCKVTGLVKQDGKTCGVTVLDTVHNKPYQLKAKAVINATGVFTNAILNMDEPGQQNLVAPSQGVHLVVDKHFFPGKHAMMIPKTDDGRVLFAVPWHDKVVLGTTDTPVEHVEVEPKPLEEEIAFILHHANRYLAATINRGDVRSMFAGLRPLVKQRHAKKTSVLSRDHTILVSASNMVTVTGGKWTTYRRMAEDAVNHAATTTGLPAKPCITKTLPIGKQAKDGDTLVHGSVTLTRETIQYFVEEEMAIMLEDILARRTRVLFLNAAEALAQAQSTAATMAEILGKDEHWVTSQVTSFKALASQYQLKTD